MSVNCNRDCLNCPYPDVPEECLDAPATYEERRDIARIEAELIRPRQRNKHKSKKWTKERAATYNKAYRAAHREEARVYRRKWYHAGGRDGVLAYMKHYRDTNKAKYGEQQAIIRKARLEAGLSQKKLAQMCGYKSAITISDWELGAKKANWKLLLQVLPQLKTEVSLDD